MSTVRARPLFIDTGAFVARFVPDDEYHDVATTVFDGIRRGEYAYRPLFTSRYVLSELVTLLHRQKSHDDAVRILRSIRESSSFTVLTLDDRLFDRTCEAFARYDDRYISFADHVTGVLAGASDVEHVFTFDPDDFRTLGFTVVPGDTGEDGGE